MSHVLKFIEAAGGLKGKPPAAVSSSAGVSDRRGVGGAGMEGPKSAGGLHKAQQPPQLQVLQVSALWCVLLSAEHSFTCSDAPICIYGACMYRTVQRESRRNRTKQKGGGRGCRG